MLIKQTQKTQLFTWFSFMLGLEYVNFQILFIYLHELVLYLGWNMLIFKNKNIYMN